MTHSTPLRSSVTLLLALEASLLVVWVFFMFWWFPFQSSAYTVETTNRLRDFGWRCFSQVTVFVGLIIAYEKLREHTSSEEAASKKHKRVPMLAYSLIFVGTLAAIFLVYEAFNMLPVPILLAAPATPPATNPPSDYDTLFASAATAAKVLSCLFIAVAGLSFLTVGALYAMTNDIMRNWAESLTKMMDEKSKKHKSWRKSQKPDNEKV